jgi:hypothetical protein
MAKNEFLASKNVKILIPIVVVAAAIYLWKFGYSFGQWLYDVIH